MEIGAIVQARTSSRRLPGKSLRLASDKPLLQYVLEKLENASGVNQILVATSTDPSDDPIESLCQRLGILCFRGPGDNVAERYRQGIKEFPFDAFLRVTGDSPLLDPNLIETAIKIFRSGKFDIVTNAQDRSFPKGQSVELVSSEIFCKNVDKFDFEEQEHITQYFYRNPTQFKIFNFVSGGQFGSVQLSVDTEEDFLAFEKILSQQKKPHWHYPWQEVLAMHLDLKERVR
jgi:spore coat polysaccharide biosynthesis protein SpsF